MPCSKPEALAPAGIITQKEQAVRRFIDCWNLSMPYHEIGRVLNCEECNALHELLLAFGAADAANALMQAHVALDDEGDDPQHVQIKVAQQPPT